LSTWHALAVSKATGSASALRRDGADVVKSCKDPLPPPPPDLKIELPSLYRIHKGDPVHLGVKPQAGVSFVWSDGQRGEMVDMTLSANSTVTVTATRAADGAKASASTYVVLEGP
jgi:hypothetical protein